jgi:hypothetical protein
MSRNTARLLFWSPRILSIAFAVFVSLFALDVFREGLGWWGTIVALVMHLIPAGIVLGALVLAWRWEWTGAVLYVAAAVAYGVRTLPRHPSWFVAIAGPLLVISAMFLLNWMKRPEMRLAR